MTSGTGAAATGSWDEDTVGVGVGGIDRPTCKLPEMTPIAG